MTSLRSRVIRLAHSNPVLRPHLLPLVVASGDQDLSEYVHTLQLLNELDVSLNESMDMINSHYASAQGASVFSPDIANQFALLKNANKGLEAAENALDGLKKLALVDPSDGAVTKLVLAMEKMVAKFQKNATKTRDAVRKLTSRETPPALKKMAGQVQKLIVSRLVDPSLLEVFTSQSEDAKNRSWPPVKGLAHDVHFRASNMKDQYGNEYSGSLVLSESTVNPGLSYGWSQSFKKADGSFFPAPDPLLNAQQAVDLFLEKTRSWSNIKGEGQKNLERATVAKSIQGALDGVLRRLGGRESERDGDMSIRGEYRSNLPKEGALEYGESEYEEMVSAEISAAHRMVSPALAPYMSSIKRVGFDAGEKSWIYITVDLK